MDALNLPSSLREATSHSKNAFKSIGISLPIWRWHIGIQSQCNMVGYLPLIDLLNRDSQSGSDVFHCLTPFWDDANVCCNSLCSDRMVSCHHDHLGDLKTGKGTMSINVWETGWHWLFPHFLAASWQPPLPFIYPNPCSTALHDCIRHSGAGRINHGDQTSETEARGGEVHLVRVKIEASGILFLIQIQVTETCWGII